MVEKIYVTYNQVSAHVAMGYEVERWCMLPVHLLRAR